MRAKGLYILGLFMLVLLLAGCTRGVISSSKGWTMVATGEVTGSDGESLPAAFVATIRGELLALDPEALRAASIGAGRFTRDELVGNGLLWSFDPQMDKDPGGTFGPAAVGDEMVYFGVTDLKENDGMLFALEKDSAATASLVAEVVWSKRFTDEKIIGGPALTLAQDMVLVGTDEGVLYALDATSGVEQWHFPRVGTIGEIWSTPTVDQERVYFGSLDHNVYALNVSDGTLDWTFPTGGGVVAQPLLVGENVFIGSFDRKLYSIDAATGVGRSVLSAGNWFWAGAVDEGSSVFVPSMDGKVYVLDRTGNLLGSVKIGGPIVSTPRVMEVEGQTFVVVANEEGDIHILERASIQQAAGEQERPPDRILGDRVKASLAGMGETVFVATTEGTVIAFEGRLLAEEWQVETR